MKNSTAVPFYIIVAAMLWGTTGTAQAFAPEGAQSIAIGTVRMILGALTLVLMAKWRGDLEQFNIRSGWPWMITVTAAASMAAYQLFFFAGVARTGVAVGTVVAIGSAPMVAGILGYLLLRERPQQRWYGATFLAISGCSVLILAGGDLQVDPWGILLALGAGSVYALYALMSKKLLVTQPAGAVTAVTFTIGAFLLLPLLFFIDLSWLLQPRGIAVALHLSVITTGLGYLLFARGLTAVAVTTATTLALAEPLTAALLGILVLDEQFSNNIVIGIGLLLGGLMLIAKRATTN